MNRLARTFNHLRARFLAWRLQSHLARWRARRAEFDEYFETTDDTRFFDVADTVCTITLSLCVAGLIGFPIADWIIRDIIAR